MAQHALIPLQPCPGREGMTSPNPPSLPPQLIVDSLIGKILKLMMMTTTCMDGFRFPSLMVPIPNHKILKQTKEEKEGMLSPRLLIRFGGRAIKFGDDFFKCWPAGGRSKVRSKL